MSAGEQIHVLTAGTWSVTIATDTGHLAAKYGPRFDRTAIVTSVRTSTHEFLNWRGLADEFGLKGDGVLGYDEAAIGGAFIKIGVGRLRRDTDGLYDFRRHWPVMELFPVEVHGCDRALDVVQDTRAGAPQAYHYRKHYALTPDGLLRIDYELANTGAVPARFEHYNHNFLCFDAAPADEAYAIAPDFALPERDSVDFAWRDGALRLRAPAHPEHGCYYGAELAGARARENRVRVRHDRGLSVEIGGDFVPSRFAVWAIADTLSPEIFFRAAIGAGETARWSRLYRFWMD